jgi:hypothetical protein
MSLVHLYASSKEDQIIIVGSDLSSHLLQTINTMEQVTLLSEKQATYLYKEKLPSTIIHFGLSIKGTRVIPQLFVPLALPNKPDYSLLEYYFLNKRFIQYLKKAAQVIAINDWAFEQIQAQYPLHSGALKKMNLPALPLPSFEWHELSKAQESLTKGNNYFLYFAPLERFKAILKEFSIFKKWQKTTMHLVFVMDHPQDLASAALQLKGYRFKDDIIILHVNDLSLAYLAASYSIFWEGVGFAKSSWMRYAIHYEVPILLDPSLNLPLSWQKAGEIFTFKEPQALSNHFKLYYKDEMYRQARAKMGTQWALSHFQ